MNTEGTTHFFEPKEEEPITNVPISSSPAQLPVKDIDEKGIC
jgi:hypothetical protein